MVTLGSVSDVGRRYAVVHEVKGPRIRLGVVWFGVLVAALVLGGLTLVVLLAVTAGVAALQVSARWREAGEPVNQWVAAAGAVLIVVASNFDDHVLGLAVIGVAAAALVFGDAEGGGLPLPFDLWSNARAAWSTLRSGLFVGLAGAATVGVAHVNSAVLIFLVVAVCVYDAGDYLCAAGYDSRLVGPLAGMLAVAVWTFGMYVFEPQPLHRGQTIWFGLLLIAACPTGQVFASWLLPEARSRAPGLRRLDSWLLAAPLFLVGLWIVT